MFGDIYRGRRVLVTGHSGFKGSWLCEWLLRMGAKVCGISLRPIYEPNHFNLLKLSMQSEWTDLREPGEVKSIVKEFRPEIIFHLAAQPLVRRSYAEPVDTFATNVMGTVNVLEAARFSMETRGIVVITSDKCYDNCESSAGYKESDPMGGFDPYSSSKGCQELVTASYRNSFFPLSDYNVRHATLVATARAGNVIGGGDWAADRLVPDLMRSASRGGVEPLRSPDSVRPWQHVLEPLSGYLELGRRLFEGDGAFAEAWNFGPDEADAITVGDAAAMLQKYWSNVQFRSAPVGDGPHEAKLLRLDCSKARTRLNWRGVWNAETAFRRTAEWYRDFYSARQIDTAADLSAYLADAAAENLAWTK